MKKNVFAKIALIAAAGFALNAFAASPATTTFQVLFKVNKSCLVTATDLNLGEVDSSGNNVVAGANGAVTVTCSKKTAYTVGLLPSGGSLLGVGVLAAQNSPVAYLPANADSITYGLYKDAAFGTPWGDSVGTNTVAGTGTGAAATVLTVYGKTTGAVNVTPDTYKDTVTVSVVY